MSDFSITVRASLGQLELDVSLSGGGAPLALVGPNGSGKTTLLRLITGALTPSAGAIQVGGALLYSSERGVDVPSELRRIGYVPQGYRLFPHLRALDNVAFGLSVGPRKQPRAQRYKAAYAMLEALECTALAERLPHQLSGGEQQRIALARALVIDPTLVLLDEPLSALDVGKRRRVRTFLAERLLSLGRPCIVITHDVRDVEALGADVCVLERGRVIQRGSLSELRRAPENEFVAELVGEGGQALPAAPSTPEGAHA